MSLILSGTDGLSDVDGSAATPAIRGTDANTGIFFGTDIIGFSEGGVEAMRINASGNLQTLATIGVGNATPSTSGAGITFPATQSASSDANTLDDYEEGTWTPVITSGGGSITSYSADGTYIKIGRSVFLTARIVLTTVGTASGNMNIAGLPFTSYATNMQMPIFVREVAVTGQTYQFFVSNSGTTATLQSLSGGGPTWTNSYVYAVMGVYPSAS
jgi:hypothetical protein